MRAVVLSFFIYCVKVHLVISEVTFTKHLRKISIKQYIPGSRILKSSRPDMRETISSASLVCVLRNVNGKQKIPELYTGGVYKATLNDPTFKSRYKLKQCIPIHTH